MRLKHTLSIGLAAAAAILTTITPATAAGTTKYVALGDSYAAGVGIPTIVDQKCSRSDHDYAHLYAAQRGYALTDVTCSGATTDSVTKTQLSAVTTDTALVTLGVGGNDIGFSDIVKSCVIAGYTGSSGTGSAGKGSSGIGTGSASGSAEALLGCKAKYDNQIPGRIAATSAKVGTLISAIHARAPHAKIVLMGYPSMVPDDVSLCSGRQPVLPADATWARDTVITGLNTMLQKQKGVEFFSTWDIYKGHDACEAVPDRWINGITVDNGNGQPFHPNQYGHAATAKKMATTITA